MGSCRRHENIAGGPMDSADFMKTENFSRVSFEIRQSCHIDVRFSF
jgi:hypothetical protein